MCNPHMHASGTLWRRQRCSSHCDTLRALASVHCPTPRVSSSGKWPGRPLRGSPSPLYCAGQSASPRRHSPHVRRLRAAPNSTTRPSAIHRDYPPSGTCAFVNPYVRSIHQWREKSQSWSGTLLGIQSSRHLVDALSRHGMRATGHSNQCRRAGTRGHRHDACVRRRRHVGRCRCAAIASDGPTGRSR
ncbi:hypothetical protein PAN31117_05363 [Pandoraea anapnoica]|uniref:Uncharacterized protein n=1 Tax=Pandoraea anapnoica TaxID=2508301 RepID=A0A5E5AS76_9BURK|nr:hypothetical protein PAN31117_05363 [Pandoraea anapnoica]